MQVISEVHLTGNSSAIRAGTAQITTFDLSDSKSGRGRPNTGPTWHYVP
jgi:hypothetical protein